MAALVTVTDALLAFPIAYYMARIASPRVRGLLVIAVLMPLWAAVPRQGLRLADDPPGQRLRRVGPHPVRHRGPGPRRALQHLARALLPVAAVHDPADLRRPRADPALAAGGLLRPRRTAGTTFRRVILPLVFPALVAGSIFTFSLTLGDYITPDLVSDAKFIGNVIYDNSSLGNLPLAAAYSLVPIVIMTVYLLVARGLGAFESL